ncbi:MAG TPA: flavodoxin family protein [Mycobacteriales bacterium]|nr:flavodoxin family protein [Mycobacteriales bacterium]
MARLLVVHHTTSPTLQALLEAALAGARDPAITGVDVVVRPALSAGPVDVLGADGYLLGTPANIGYMSGALKHFFDQVYYPCLEATRGRPYAAYVHGASDVTGAIRAIGAITTGLGWRPVGEPLSITGTPRPEQLAACRDLAATVAATCMLAGGPDPE